MICLRPCADEDVRLFPEFAEIFSFSAFSTQTFSFSTFYILCKFVNFRGKCERKWKRQQNIGSFLFEDILMEPFLECEHEAIWMLRILHILYRYSIFLLQFTVCNGSEIELEALFLAFHNLCFSVKISHFRILWLDIIFLLCVIHSETFDWLRSCNTVCHFAAYTKALALVNKHIFFKFTFFHGIFSQLQNLLRFPSKKYFIIFFFIFVYLPALYFRPLNCVWLFLWFSFSFFQFVF